MSAEVPVAVLVTDGINCDMEMGHAFEVAGAKPEKVHINQLRSRERKLGDFAVLAIPGGFSYGDDVASGAILANELRTQLEDDITEFVSDEKPVIGICNGFQVLVKAGILPSGNPESQTASLIENENGSFICKWVELDIGATACKFTDGLEGINTSIPMQIAHGEGRFVASEHTIKRLGKNGQVVFRYKNNSNGSQDDIAGICDPKGLVLGMMPHPERSIAGFHPDRSRTKQARTSAELIFKNIVNYAKES